MESGNLLAHVVSHFTPEQWENIATEALAYLLTRPGADDAFRDTLAVVGMELPGDYGGGLR